MFARLTLIAVVALFTFGSVRPLGAANLADIKRVIYKEPAYQTEPGYCLLVFGKDAKTAVWLMHDGNDLYVDRKANGDLTEPENKISSPTGKSFVIDKLVEEDGTEHRNFRLQCLDDGTFRMAYGYCVNTRTVGYASVGRPKWSSHPSQAPIIHCNGPLSLANLSPSPLQVVGTADKRHVEIRLALGTPGLGQGTFVCTNLLRGYGPIQAEGFFRKTGARCNQVTKHSLTLTPKGGWIYHLELPATVEPGFGWARLSFTKEEHKGIRSPAVRFSIPSLQDASAK